jgi:tetratricopeptide (TPR) repeat protein
MLNGSGAGTGIMRTLSLKSSKQIIIAILATLLLSAFGCSSRYASVRQELENQNYEIARDQILSTYPHDAHYNMLLAEASYNLKDFDTFVEAVSRSLRQGDEFRADLLYLMQLADVELTQKAYDSFTASDYDATRILIDQVLRVRYYLDWVLKPFAKRALSVSEMLEYSSESLVKEGRYDEARTLLVHLTADSLRRLNVHERLAYIYYESNQYGHANDLIKQILSPQPGAPGMLLYSDQLRSSDYLTDSVLSAYDPKIRERQLIERPLMDSHIGSSFYNINDWNNSRFRFEMVLRTDPLNAVDFFALIGESYFLEKDYLRAAQVFEDALVVDPTNEDVIQYLAISRFNLGQKALADSLFTLARTYMDATVLDPSRVNPDTTRLRLEGP